MEQEEIRVEIEEFPSNSDAKKQSRVEGAVASAKPIPESRGVGRMFKNIFSGDDIKTAMAYVAVGVIFPSVKNMVFEALTKGLEKVMWEDGNPRSTVKPGSVINYSAISTQNRATNYHNRASVSRNDEHNTDSYVIESRGQAEEVLGNLLALISTYGHATVSDYYELIGKTGAYTDHKWGWTNLSSARVNRMGAGGYVISLPRAEPIT